jgi:hypothetical protein
MRFKSLACGSTKKIKNKKSLAAALTQAQHAAAGGR